MTAVGPEGDPRDLEIDGVEGLTQKSDGEWAGRRQPGGAGSCCAAVGLGSGGGVGDDGFAVADGDVLAGERLELGGEVAGAAVFVLSGIRSSRARGHKIWRRGLTAGGR